MNFSFIIFQLNQSYLNLGEGSRGEASRVVDHSSVAFTFPGVALERETSFPPVYDPLIGFPGGSVAKNPPAMQEAWVWSLGQEDLMKEEMSTHSSILAWEIPWTEEPGGLQSIGLQRVGYYWATNETTTQPTFTLRNAWEISPRILSIYRKHFDNFFLRHCDIDKYFGEKNHTWVLTGRVTSVPEKLAGNPEKVITQKQKTTPSFQNMKCYKIEIAHLKMSCVTATP